MILVDTSAWADFFRDKDPFASRVDELLEKNQVAIAGPIMTELLRGVRVKRERENLLRLLEGCHWLDAPYNLWTDAGMLGATLAARGHTGKTLDLLIATYALAYDIPLLTKDADFANMKRAGAAIMLA